MALSSVFAMPAPTSLALALVTPNWGTGTLVDDFRDRSLNRLGEHFERALFRHGTGRRSGVSGPLAVSKSSRPTIRTDQVIPSHVLEKSAPKSLNLESTV